MITFSFTCWCIPRPLTTFHSNLHSICTFWRLFSHHLSSWWNKRMKFPKSLWVTHPVQSTRSPATFQSLHRARDVRWDELFKVNFNKRGAREEESSRWAEEVKKSVRNINIQTFLPWFWHFFLLCLLILSLHPPSESLFLSPCYLIPCFLFSSIFLRLKSSILESFQCLTFDPFKESWASLETGQSLYVYCDDRIK